MGELPAGATPVVHVTIHWLHREDDHTGANRWSGLVIGLATLSHPVLATSDDGVWTVEELHVWSLLGLVASWARCTSLSTAVHRVLHMCSTILIAT